MEDFKISVSGGALMGFALLYFFDDSGILAALLPAVIAHELGHAAMLLLLRSRLTGLHLTLAGFRMEYSCFPGQWGEAAVMAAGPLCGLLYALVAAMLGEAYANEFLIYSAGISVALSAYNLLPAPMLDGGQLVRMAFGPRAALICGCVSGFAAAVLGLVMAARGYGIALAAAGCGILIGTCKWGRLGIK